MKVIHVETGINLYGGALQVLYLVRGLYAEGVHNILVCAEDSEIGTIAKPFADVCELTCRGELDAVFGHRLYQLVRDEKPDILHIHSRRGADLWGSLVVRRTGQAAVLTRRVDNPERAWLARWKYRPFRKIVTISEKIRQVLESEGVPSEKIVCVHSALDAVAYHQKPDREWFRHEFDLPENAIAIGVIAQLIERKGHRYLIESAPQILKDCPDTYFLFFGKGPERETLEKLCRQAGMSEHIRFPGFRDDLPRILPNLDLVVHPALMEGLGIALLQASAAGVPVVAARAGGVPEAVRTDINGVLVEPRDVNGLAYEIMSLLADPTRRSMLGAGGRSLVEVEFSTSAMVKSNLAIYGSIIESFRGGAATPVAQRRKG